MSRTKDDRACRLSMTVNGIAHLPTVGTPYTDAVPGNRAHPPFINIFSPCESSSIFNPTEFYVERGRPKWDLFWTGCIAVFSGTPYGDKKFPFEKEIGKVGQDTF